VIGLEGGRPYVELAGGAGTQRASATAVPPLPAQSWHHLAVVAGNGITLYLDGVRAAAVEAQLPALSERAFLGGEAQVNRPASPAKKGTKAEPAVVASTGLKGELDELQISKLERPAAFIRFAAIGQGADAGKLIAAGAEEQKESGSSGYFGIILQSVTLDGWVVIALLAVMALISWFVMVTKAAYVSRVERANARFAAQFREASAELARFVERGRDLETDQRDAKAFRDSPLYRIFVGGAEEIRKRTDGTRPLHAEAIEAIRSGLHAELLRASQRLNRNMVLLTIAISGGPFLGLLGTVVGVMITFAAIAAAGDVNVNAIAPGIAAALVATVAGLGVAIPALFGYNWLLTRIKNSTTTMQVFVDELVTKVAEAYSERTIAEGRTRPSRLAAAE
jgi:biopolymer transport protein ExbB